MFSIRQNGQIDKLDLRTGQIVYTLQGEMQQRQEGIAFADSAFWTIDLDDRLLRIDANDGTISPLFGNLDVGQIQALASTASPTFASMTGSAFTNAVDIGFSELIGAFPKRSGNVLAIASIQLPHGANIQSLRCVVGDTLRKGYITASLIRASVKARVPGNLPEVVASISSSRKESQDVIELSRYADTALARVDNRNYGYYIRVEFVGARQIQQAIPETMPALFIRGCTINVN